MASLEIVFTRSKKRLPVIGWLIQLYTGKPYSHCALSQQICDWGYRFFQASEGKVNYEYQDEFFKKHEIVKSYKFLVDELTDLRIKKETYKQCGVPYGLLQNLGIIWADICKLFGKRVANPFKAGKNCSELIYTAVLRHTLPDLDVNPDLVKPHHIEKIILGNYIEKNGYWVPK